MRMGQGGRRVYASCKLRSGFVAFVSLMLASSTVTEIFAEALAAIATRPHQIKISGLWNAAKALFLYAIAASGHAFCAVTASPAQAEQLYQDIDFFFRLYGHPKPLLYHPAGEDSAPCPDDIAQRLRMRYQLAQDDRCAVVTSIAAFLQSGPSADFLMAHSMLLKVGQTLAREELEASLSQQGYTRTPVVSQPGEIAIRGSLVDFFSPVSIQPVRVEFFSDRIESLRLFDPISQRSIATLPSAELIPWEHVLADTVPLFSVFAPETLLILDEPDAIESFLPSTPGLEKAATRRTTIALESLPLHNTPGVARFMFDSHPILSLGLGRPHLPFSDAVETLRKLSRDHTVIIAASHEDQAARLGRFFSEHHLPWIMPSGTPDPQDYGAQHPRMESPAAEPVCIVCHDLSEGCYFPNAKYLVLTEEALIGKKNRAPHRDARGFSDNIFSFHDIKIGDYVVHLHHGIGRYIGLTPIKTRLQPEGPEVALDFFTMTYAGGDKIYIPMDGLHQVQRYVGSGGGPPALDHLGGTRWAKAKAQASKKIQDMLEPLLKLYAERQVIPGHAFSPPELEMDRFSAAFEYELTPDQKHSIQEVLADMQQNRPMDRLVCGDVGFGKTEVAMQAAFCAVLDQKEVAVVTPTTLLAHQHYQTFKKRFSAFPVRVEAISRFQAPAEQKKILADLQAGLIDILIGTHRLLQKDVQFSRLGLVVIDEEHRFGVRHKEWLKEMRKQVDVLTLTATPIPRTLHMTIAEMRDLSVIETPPADRLPIQTFMIPFDPTVIREACVRELRRGGQIFFVHDKVQGIETLGTYLISLVPEMRVGIAHGQMGEQQLQSVIVKFIAKEYDLLLTTTIVESGIDIPSANTMLVNNADRFGLAELYQLRGRVGRARIQAYAYFVVPEERVLGEDARQRLRVISELTALGSGFKIAARDLEIRGAGDLLGAEQSGQVAAVGFELYLKMIDEAARKLRGTPPPAEIEPTLQLTWPACLPESYIGDAGQRLLFYRRFSGAQNAEAIEKIETELKDRFGALPDEARCLCKVMRIKQMAKTAGISKMIDRVDAIAILFDPAAPHYDPQCLITRYGKRLRFTSASAFELTPSGHTWAEVSDLVCECLEFLLSQITHEAEVVG